VRQIKFYKYTDAKSCFFLPPEIVEIRCLCLRGTFFIHPLWFISHDIPPPLSSFMRMSSHCLDDNPFSFNFSYEFLAAFDFGCKFGGNGDASNVSASCLLFSFGSYNQDNASFSFSVDSYVGFVHHCHHRHRKHCPNRMYCKKSVKQSCW
jgi:hypothetical protein